MSKDKFDEIIMLPFMQGIESDRLTDGEVRHRMEAFRNSSAYREIRTEMYWMIYNIYPTWEKVKLSRDGYEIQRGERLMGIAAATRDEE